MTATFFDSRAKFRAWLKKHHASETELWIGFYKKASGRPSVTYKEALDEALCFGWIDGVRRRVDEEAYVQRFTPRRKRSYWSAVNVKRAQELIKEQQMAAPGLEAFERRDREASARYSFERETAGFDPAQLKKFKANKKAWAFYESQAPYYRRIAAHWVTSAKKPETRDRRLATLIGSCAAGKKFGVLTPASR